MNNNYAVFILSHGRPDRIYTYGSLRRQGYTGRIVIVVDNLDKEKDEYVRLYGDEVVVFDKPEVAKTFDVMDNFPNYRSVIYARNAAFEIARRLEIQTFIVLDDDYRHFQYRYDSKIYYAPRVITNLDAVFDALVKFHRQSGALSVAIGQGGDFIGGEDCQNAKQLRLSRKLMNFWVCSTDRPFPLVGRLNDDVNTYVSHGARGKLFFTTFQVSLEQMQTQTNAGGLTELYLDMGTYVKSFYTVMIHPSSVKVRALRDRNRARLHHAIKWDNTVPKILSERVKRGDKNQ